MTWAFLEIFIKKDIDSGLVILAIQLAGGSLLIYAGLKASDWRKRYDVFSSYCIGFGILALLMGGLFLYDSEKFSDDFWKGIYYLVIAGVLIILGGRVIVKHKVCPECRTLINKDSFHCEFCGSALTISEDSHTE